MSDPGANERPSRDLREYLGILRLRKWTILFVSVLVTAGAVFFSSQQTPIYGSEAKVLVKAVPLTSSGGSLSIPNLETEKELVLSEAVGDIAHDEMPPGEELSPDSVSVDVATETEILVIGYTDPNARTAQHAAQAYADAYIEFRRQEVVDDLLASSQTVQQQIADLNRQLSKTNSEIRDARSQSVRTTLQTQANALVSQIAVLQQELTEATPPENLRVGQVVEQATLSTSPVSPNHLANGILGLLVGLALGIGIAFLRERLDDRVRDRASLEKYVGVPVMAVVPRVQTWRRGTNPVLITIAEPRSAASEAYRTLRTALLFTSAQRRVKTILLTSARAGEGKTVTTANLGVALAQTGRRVVLVSADLRKPRLATFFGEQTGFGLTNIFSGETTLWKAIADSGIDNLKLLPSGPIPANPAELLGSDAMKSVLSQLAAVADFVLIDGPPTLTLADAITLAPLADGVLFVTDAQATRRGAVEHSRQQLEQVDARLLGAVLNNFDPAKTGGGYDYYYGDYYAEKKTGRSLESRGKRRGSSSSNGTSEDQDVKPVWL